MISKLILSLLALTALAGSQLEESHLARLRATNDKYGFNSSIAERFGHYDAFLIGFKSNSVIPSAQNCSKNLERSIYVWNDTQVEWANQTSVSTKDQLFDTTYWVSYSIAPSTDNCFGSIIESYNYTITQTAKFTGVGSWLAACIQNLLANVSTITQIQDKITAAQEINDTIAVSFWYGRLSNIGLIFEPIPVDTYN